jgi:subtilisin-like proprotein convertase family protein
MSNVLSRAIALSLALACAQAAATEEDRYFDLRLSPEKSDSAALQRLRAATPAARVRTAQAQAAMREAESALRREVPGLQILASAETGGPEVVGVARGHRVLTAPSNASREQIARGFIERNAALYGLNRQQAAQLKLDADYVNPTGNLGWVRLAHEINGLPVFRSEVQLAITPAGEIARTVGQLAAAIDEREAPTAALLDPRQGVLAAAAAIGVSLDAAALIQRDRAPDDRWARFGTNVFVSDVKAEKVYFPLGDGALDLAWSMVLWQPQDAHYILVSASDGTLLFRKNITESEAYSFAVYNGSSPAPFLPGPVNPNLGEQAPAVLRDLVTVNGSQITTSDPLLHPWLPPGPKVTDGNNVEAGLDIAGPNGVDATVPETSPNVFNYGYNPPPGLPPPGDVPTLASTRNGTVVNLFYWSNRFHDLTYDLGFTEPARNFQQDNYGRGGLGSDRVSAEAQDSSGTNNANFSTPADGGRGRMQMYIWTGPDPDRDGSLDADIVIHELAHGLSNRLHGNASGLGTNMARGMGEGWSDYYAHAFLAKPDDPIDGIYTVGGYSTYLAAAGFTGNYYYGIRRFPKAIMSSTGGPNNRPHNPLTFADLDDLQIDLTDGAFPRGPFGAAPADAVHNAGEIWSSALWEARAQVIGQMGAEEGNQRMLQLVTDGMKLSPLNPTFLQSRDAILAADCAAFGGESELQIWAGFAIRGMGYGAQVTSISPARVVESFAGPLELANNGYVNSSCAASGRNPTPGETIQIQVEVGNPLCGADLANVTVSVAGGGAVFIPLLEPGQTTTVDIDYTVPPDAECGSVLQVDVNVDHDLGARSIAMQVPVGENAVDSIAFSNNAPIAVPGANTSGPAAPYPSTINVAGVTGPMIGARVSLNNVSHTWPNDIDVLLIGPGGQSLIVLSDAFGNGDPDGLVPSLELRDDADTIAPLANTAFNGNMSFRPTNHSAGDVFAGAPAGPYGEAAPAGAATFASVFGGTDPNGAWSLYVVDDAGSDIGQIAGGWTLTILTQGEVGCLACLLDVGGDLAGLSPGNSVSVQLNGGEELVLGSDGPFTFAGKVERGEDYAVSISAQPVAVDPGQRCAVQNGVGTMGANHVDDVAVTCIDTWTVGGMLQGLAAGAEVTLQNNGGDDLVLSANGAFSFAQAVDEGGSYAVSVSTQPDSPAQECAVSAGSGTIAGAAVTGVTVECLGFHALGGSLSGLQPGTSLQLRLSDDGGNEVLFALDENGPWVAPIELLDGRSFDLEVVAKPTGPSQTCDIAGGSGTVESADVEGIDIVCSIDAFAMGGTLSGLPEGTSLQISLNGGEPVTLEANGAFSLDSLLDGSAYSVVVVTQPDSTEVICGVENGSGELDGAPVSDIAVVCLGLDLFGDSFE